MADFAPVDAWVVNVLTFISQRVVGAPKPAFARWAPKKDGQSQWRNRLPSAAAGGEAGFSFAVGEGREEERMHAAIRQYQVDPGSVDEITRGVNEGLLPLMKDVSGFQAYYALDAGGGRIASVSVFEDRAGAEESSRLAADWVRQNMASLFPNPPEVLQGEVVAHEAASAGAVSGITGTVGGVTDPVRGVTDKFLGGGQEKQR